MFQTPKRQACLSRELRDVLQQRNMLTAKSRRMVCSMLDRCESSSVTSMHNIVSPLTARLSDSELDKRKGFRKQALQEIITTEKTYIRQLEILMQYFVRPLKEQSIIDDASYMLLFGQIEMIHNLNGEFLCELEQDVEQLAQAFLKMAPFFKLYSVYAFDYRNALFMLQDLTNKNPVFRKFVEENETRPEVQKKLNSLMIAPIQRVPRYKLLLEQVLQYTSPADKDYKMLKESIKQIEYTVTHINSCVEDQEITQKLINIQNSLLNRTPNIVKPSRKVIKEGVLNKVNHKGVEMKRYGVLMSDIFMYCKILKDRAENTVTENALECCCIFPLKKCKVYQMFPGTFKVTCQGDGIILCAADQLSCLSWVSLIQEAINTHVLCRKTLRKESSKRKPLRKKDLKKFGLDYDVLSPTTKKKLDYETVFRNRNRATDSSDGECDTLSFNCFKPKKSSNSNAVGVHSAVACTYPMKGPSSDENQRHNLRNEINSVLSKREELKILQEKHQQEPQQKGRIALKRPAPAPPTPRPITQRTVCSPAFTRATAVSRPNVNYREKFKRSLSNTFRYLRARKNAETQQVTTTAGSGTARPALGYQLLNRQTTTTTTTTATTNNENEANDAFTISRYSDSKSYFRAHNVDNTIPTAIKREDIFLSAAPNDEGRAVAAAASDDFGFSEFENPNFRDILYPLRCSGGSSSSKSSMGGNYSNANDLTDSNDKHRPTISGPLGTVMIGNNWMNSNAFANCSDEILAAPIKRVKFEMPAVQRPFDFAPVSVMAPASHARPTIASTLREKVGNFFAKLF